MRVIQMCVFMLVYSKYAYGYLTRTNCNDRMALYSCTRVAQRNGIWHGIRDWVVVGNNSLMVEKGPANPFFYCAKKIGEVLRDFAK